METLSEALKDEIKKAGTSYVKLAKHVGCVPSYISMLAKGEKTGYGAVERVAMWLFMNGGDARRVVTAAIAERNYAPIYWLENPEARWRLASYAAKLWLEEQENKSERTKNAVHD